MNFILNKSSIKQMKNLIITTALLMAALSQSYSQNKKAYIGVSVGPSFPFYEYGSSDLDNENAGLAKTGTTFDVSFTYRFGKHFGISGLVRGQSHPTNTDAILDYVRKEVPYAKWTVDAGKWWLGGTMVGGYGTFPFTEKIHFDAKAMAGVMIVSSPDVNINGSNFGNNVWTKQRRATSGESSLLLGGGFRFDMGESICLLANLDVFYMQPKFVGIETESSSGSLETFTVTQMITTLNLTFGAAVKF